MTKAESIALQIKEEIAQGVRGGIGERFMSVRDVCGVYGVSYATAAKILRDLRRENILSLKNNTYYINDCFSSADTSKRILIGVHVRDIRYFYADLLSALAVYAKKKDIDLVIMSSGNNNAEKRNILNRFIALGCKGVINLNSYNDIELLGFYKLYPLPFVMFGHREFDGVNTDFIYTDNIGSGRLAAKHLIDCGAEKFYYISVERTPNKTDERFLGFNKYLTEAGLFVEAIKLADDENDPDGYNFLAEKLYKDSKTKKLGIFCHHDLLAVTMLALLKKKGIAVPEKAAVIGYDDLQVASYVSPKITTFSYNYRLIAESLISCLLNRIRLADKKPSSMVIPTVLVIRGSSKLTD